MTSSLSAPLSLSPTLREADRASRTAAVPGGPAYLNHPGRQL